MRFVSFSQNYLKPLATLEGLLYIDYAYMSVVGSGGKDLNKYIYENEKDIFISLFPGIVADNQIEAFISRLKCDLVLVNSKKDEQQLKKICKIFKVPYNGFLYGASWYSKCEKIDNSLLIKKYIVFFEQIDVPKVKTKRLDLLQKLCDLARKNPNRNFLIKSREEFVERDSSLVSLSKEFIFPKNLNFTKIDTNILIHHMDVGISISSSTAIEAILAKKRFILISDYGYKNTYLDFYKNSNLILRFNCIDFEKLLNVDENWKKLNIESPYSNIKKLETVLMNIQKTNRCLDVNILTWIKLIISYPKIFLNNPKITYKKLQKSIKMIKGETK